MILADLGKCDRMMQTITTVEDGLKVAATADALLAYAKKVQAGIDVQNRCTGFRAKAERRCGLIRDELGKAKGATEPGTRRGTRKEPRENPPTTSDLHLTKKTSARMSKLAKVGTEAIEAAVAQANDSGDELSLPKLVDAVTVATKKKQREDTWVDAVIPENILVGDFREVGASIPDNSVSLIFTDPPYDRKASEMLPELAVFASAKLVVGGSLLCYVGETQLPGALDAFRSTLRYWWTIACVHSGHSTVMREYGVNAAWKPILWFVKGTRHDTSTMVRDVVSGGEEKQEHPWQQAQAEAEYLIEKLCPAEGIVLDPFLGSGTTAAAAKKLGRRWIGIEIDEKTAKIASGRIGV
jgi:hypothetical protein